MIDMPASSHTEIENGQAGAAVRYAGATVTCTGCGCLYPSRSFEPVKASLCETCRLSRQDTETAKGVVIEDYVTTRILAESFDISVQQLVGLARILWKGLMADDHLTSRQEQKLTEAAEAMACEY